MSTTYHPQPAEADAGDAFANIAAKLSNLSKRINMDGPTPLGERSVNIPPPLTGAAIVSLHYNYGSCRTIPYASMQSFILTEFCSDLPIGR